MTPVSSYPSKRNPNPLVFFKGSLKEARTLTHKDVHDALKQSGVRFSWIPFLRKRQVQQFHRQLQSHLKEFEGQRATGNKNPAIVIAPVPGGAISLKIQGIGKDRIIIAPHPSIHGITLGGVHGAIPFKVLQNILETGFQGTISPNVLVPVSRKALASYAAQNPVLASRQWYPKDMPPELAGDTYTLYFTTSAGDRVWPGMAAEPPGDAHYFTEPISKPEVTPPEKQNPQAPFFGFVKRRSPSQILRVNVGIPHDTPAHLVAFKREFYKKFFAEQNIPHRLVKREPANP